MSTIKDIANAANVSISTVSRVLNRDATLNVSTTTRSNIFKIADELNYIKRDIKTKNVYKPLKVNIILWCTKLTEQKDTYYLSIRKAAQNYLLNKGAIVQITYCDQLVNDHNLDSYDAIIAIGRFSKDEISNFRKSCQNIIFVDMYMQKIYVNTIILDIKNAMFDTIHYLLKLNHTTIGFLGGLEYTSDGSIYVEQRLHFFKYYCKKFKLDYEDYIQSGTFSAESGYTMATNLIKSKKIPTAIFCASDNIAQGAMKALKEHNIKVPEDVSIIGFNNNQDVSTDKGFLTSVNVPTTKLGEFSAKFIYDQANTQQVCPIRLTFPCELIIRKSCFKAW